MDFPLKSVFLALPLEQDALARFQEYANVLRFQNPETPHLTLMYWPEVSQLEFQGIVEQVRKIAVATDPFTINITGADTFGSRDEDKVLFLDIAFSDELARVKKRCPWTDGHPFHPHITLARMRHPQKFSVVKKKIMKQLKNAKFPASFDCLRLYAEVDGVKQTPLGDFVL